MLERRYTASSVSRRPSTGGASPRLKAVADHWWLVAMPAFLFVALFFVYPTALILGRAFTQFSPPEIGGFDNFSWFLGNSANQTILVRTFAVALLCTVTTSVIAFPYAYLMTTVSGRWRTAMMGALLVSMFFGILLRNFAWVVLLQRTGPLNDLIEWLGFERVRFLGTTLAVVMGMTHILFPFMALPLFAVLRGIDRRLVLAAQSLGATPNSAFWQVYIPLAMPGIFAGSLLVFVLALGFYITPAILGSSQQALMSQLMYSQFTSQAAFGRAGTMAIVLLLLTLGFVGLATILQRRSKAYGA
ncbi:ABC transporter permease [Ensifer adhaerens]|uniref:ABC transporter permease n=1 Tax=Ensifer adhaerens TaxID=106592 RepID=UPI001C4E017C|nr:ABC transporter permease [Ensifer adhaerens]MBW0370813.1 ABC transporter permease [Ensifer adhaerens]UCM24271.1 ABC transporter permease [Ensifer adhaerens]